MGIRGAKTRGVVAAGHAATADAARAVLEAGGNAFDAIVAAAWTACVAEPVLASVGGGGFLLARPASARPVLYDFFTQTPRRRRPQGEVDFHPIVADFGTATQEFHIGMGSIATPGMVKGLFRVQSDLGRLPMAELVAPAVAAARDGLTLNALQAYIFRVVGPIYQVNPESRAVLGSRVRPGELVQEGERVVQPDLADTLEALAQEGEALFYRGDIAARMAADCRTDGGHLTAEDLAEYQVLPREPLAVSYRGARFLTNPPPSAGGVLIAFSLRLLQALDLTGLRYADPAYLSLLARVMATTNQARSERYDGREHDAGIAARLLDGASLAPYLAAIAGHFGRLGGTTQVSVMDGEGNLASLTASNGEGSGYVVPGSGVMLNNMLGEEDVNPHGFHRWRTDTRIASMMAPSLVLSPDCTLAVGSGGSNRIRTAILQVLVKRLDFGLRLEEAVNSPRIHMERDLLSIEGGFDPAVVDALRAQFPRTEVWDGLNLFFGGVHSVALERGGFAGAGDVRRGGVVRVVE